MVLLVTLGVITPLPLEVDQYPPNALLVVAVNVALPFAQVAFAVESVITGPALNNTATVS